MLNLLTDDIKEALRPLGKITCVVTAGNSYRKDDGVGPYIAHRLIQNDTLKVVNAGYTPENIIDDVVALNPQKIIFIDSADFGAPVGTMHVIPENQIDDATFSTHRIPLPVIGRLITETTHSRVCYIAIQPKSFDFEEGLSDNVKKSAHELINYLNTIYS